MEMIGLKLCSFFVVLWLVIMAFSKGQRLMLLAGSTAYGLLGPVLEYWHVQDYWHPPYVITISYGPVRIGLEDLIFCFCFSGICIGGFLWSHKAQAIRAGLTALGMGLLISLVGLGILMTGVLVIAVRLNSVYAVSIAALTIGCIVLVGRSQWIRGACFSAVLVTGVMWSFYALFALVLYPDLFTEFWKQEGLSGHALLAVPIEELVWAGAMGVGIGPVYLFCLEWGRKVTDKLKPGTKRSSERI